MRAAATLPNYQLQSHQLFPQPLSKSNTLLSSHPPHPSPPNLILSFPSFSFLPNINLTQLSYCYQDVKKLGGRRKSMEGFSCRATVRPLDGGRRPYGSPWDDRPYEILPNGKRAYLDEQDVVTFLDPLKDLIPLDPTSYNPAAYLWKKIDDVPEERRYRLIHLLDSRLISRAWEIAGTRYEDSKLAKLIASNLLLCEDGERLPELYHCRSSGGPPPIAWMKFFKKAIFRCKSGKIYGRFIAGGVVGQIANTISPLYFLATEHREVMATEQPCDLAYEFGDGHLNVDNYPLGFPKPGKHPYPFNDEVVVYVRHLGPGVSVGQAWQEGKELHQVPQKLCGEILMVKDYTAASTR